MRIRSILLALAVSSAALPAAAETIIGLDQANSLFRFDSATPGATTSIGLVSGLTVGETLIGIDVRPANDTLYGLTSAGGIYAISFTGGAATASGRQQLRTVDPVTMVSTPLALTGTTAGIDFNPVPDRLRIVTNADQNLRVNVATGVALVDGNLNYPVGDANAGADPSIVANAYTNSFAPSPRNGMGQPVGPGTQLYYLDSNLNILATTTNPNGGALTTIGGAGNPNELTGFDISGLTGVFYASWLRGSVGLDGFFTLNPATGGPSLVGNIGSGSLGIRDIAVAPTFVPTPASLALFGLALGGLALARRRRG